MFVRLAALTGLLCALSPDAAATSAAAPPPTICGELKNAFGPYDYRKGETELAHELWLVESTHFFPDVENLIKGRSGSLGNEMDYTLRAFPNHVRALNAMGRLAARERTVVLPGVRYPVECYFDRAVRFAPDDGAVRGVYGTFLYQHGQYERALEMFLAGIKLSPLDPTINYNLGLSLHKAKRFDEANYYAQRAYALGFPLPGLKNLLLAAGKWNDKVETGIEAKAAEAPEAPAGAEAKASVPAAAAK